MNALNSHLIRREADTTEREDEHDASHIARRFPSLPDRSREITVV